MVNRLLGILMVTYVQCIQVLKLFWSLTLCRIFFKTFTLICSSISVLNLKGKLRLLTNAKKKKKKYAEMLKIIDSIQISYLFGII